MHTANMPNGATTRSPCELSRITNCNSNGAGPSKAHNQSRATNGSVRMPPRKRKRRNRSRNRSRNTRQSATMQNTPVDLHNNRSNQPYGDILGTTNLNDASYEELLAKYETIQRKLSQLNNKNLENVVEQQEERMIVNKNAKNIRHSRQRKPQDVDERFQSMPANLDSRFCDPQQQNINPIDPRFVQQSLSVPSTSQKTYLRPRSDIIETADKTNNIWNDYPLDDKYLADLMSDDEFLSATSNGSNSPLSQTNNEQTIDYNKQSRSQDRPYSPGDSLIIGSPTLTISSDSSSVILCDEDDLPKARTRFNTPDLAPGYDAASCDMEISDLSDIDTDFEDNDPTSLPKTTQALSLNNNQDLPSQDLPYLECFEKNSPDSPSESEDIQNESQNKKRVKIIPESEDEQGVDEAIIRAQLLITEVSKRLDDEKKKDVQFSAKTKFSSETAIKASNVRKKPEPFIIQINNCTSDEEETDDSNTEQTNAKQGIHMSAVQEFLKDARENCDQMIVDGRTNEKVEPNKRVNSTAYDVERYKIEQKEHSTSQDVLLRKKELKIKLIKAGLLRNDANLVDIRTEVVKRRERMRKFKAYAHKLRARYLEAAKMARASIQEFKIFEEKLINQEKHINAGRSQLTKLENDCRVLGKSVVGTEYRLPGSDGDKNRIELASRLKSAKKMLTARLQEMDKHASPNSPAGDMRVKALSDISSSFLQNQGSDLYERIKSSRIILRNYIDWTLTPRMKHSFVCFDHRLMYKPMKFVQFHMLPDSEYKSTSMSEDLKAAINESSILRWLENSEIAYKGNSDQTKKNQRPHLSNGASLLSCLSTLRLESRFSGTNSLTSWSHAHNIYPSDYICNADLLGSCQDNNCLYQHKSKYLMSNVEKLVDLLSYRPSIAGFKFNPDISQEDNYTMCRTKLRQYAQNLLDTNPDKPLELIAENLIKWLRCASKESDLILLTRQLPKASHCGSPSLTNQNATLIDENNLRRLAGRVEFVPHAEYEFNFDFMIQDDSYRLKHSKISKLSEIDPEMSIKFRFFAEGRPISTELETALEADPNNVQLWLKLAYHNLIRNPSNKAENVDRSMNVLSRALEANPNDPELWETYLILYANRVPRPNESDKMDLSNICELALQKCPTISMYKIYLSLTPSIKKKLSAARKMLASLLSESQHQDIKNSHSGSDKSSQHIVEIVLFICSIHRHLGQEDKALEIATKAFSSQANNVNSLDGEDDDYIPNVSRKLNSRDLQFSRMCVLYWKIYGRFPETRVEPHGFSLPKVLSTSPFLIFVENKDDARERLQCILDEDFGELALTDFNPHGVIDHSYMNLLLISHTIEETQASIEEEESLILYSLAKKKFSDGDVASCCEQLYTIYSKYNTDSAEKSTSSGEPQSLNHLRTIFGKLLSFNQKDLFKTDLHKIDSRNKRSIILWLCFILINKMFGSTVKHMEFIYNEGINSCSAAMIDQTLNVTILIYDYIKYLVNNISDLARYQHILTTVRHCCVTIAEEEFQIHIIELLLIVVTDIKTSLNLLFEFCLLLPTNAALINWTIRMALANNMKEFSLKLVDFLLFERKSHIVHDEWFWTSALSLVIDSGDHLKAHRIFRLAIGNQPYSVKLWKMVCDISIKPRPKYLEKLQTLHKISI